jgi:hypothetical protein
MLPEVQSLLDGFNSVTKRAEKFNCFVRGAEFQKDAIQELKAFIPRAEELKRCLAKRGEADSANFLLGLISILNALEQELEMILALKNDNPDAAWSCLVSAQTFISTAMKAHTSFEYLHGYLGKLDAQEKIFFPPQTFCSPGLIVRKSKCSICNSDYGECEHIKGTAYNGELCVRIIEQAELLEMSIVEEPANKHARAYSLSEKGEDRDIMTWRIRKKADGDPKGESQDKSSSSEMLMLPGDGIGLNRDSTHFAYKAVSSIDNWLNRPAPSDSTAGA